MEKHSNKPAVYYIVRELLHESGKIQEKIFYTRNPLHARTAAISYYRKHASDLCRDGALSCSKYGAYRDNIYSDPLSMIASSAVIYTSLDENENGISLYMIIERPLISSATTEKPGSRHLLHGVWNFSPADMQQMIQGLLLEHRYYTRLHCIPDHLEDRVDFNDYKAATGIYGTYPILSIPFDWVRNNFLVREKAKRRSADILHVYNIHPKTKKHILPEFQTTLYNRAFIQTWNEDFFLIQIASFLNADGGSLHYKINLRKDLFSHADYPAEDIDFEVMIMSLIQTELGTTILNLIDVSSIRYETPKACHIVTIKIEPLQKEKHMLAVFIKREKEKILYTRSEYGIQPIYGLENIINHLTYKVKKQYLQ